MGYLSEIVFWGISISMVNLLKKCVEGNMKNVIWYKVTTLMTALVCILFFSANLSISNIPALIVVFGLCILNALIFDICIIISPSIVWLKKLTISLTVMLSGIAIISWYESQYVVLIPLIFATICNTILTIRESHYQCDLL
jgi:hypothetical protein